MRGLERLALAALMASLNDKLPAGSGKVAVDDAPRPFPLPVHKPLPVLTGWPQPTSYARTLSSGEVAAQAKRDRKNAKRKAVRP